MKKSNKNVFLKFLSFILAMVMCTANMVPAFAQTDKNNESNIIFDSGNPVIVSTEVAAGSMNLTELGTLDWIHITGDEVNQKKDSGNIISWKNLSVYPVSTLTDSPVKYSWTDGDPQETVTGYQRGGIFNYKAGDESVINMDIPEDAGYELSIPAADYARQLIFVSGIWEAQANISISVNGADSPSYEADLQATDPENVKKYTVSVRAGYSMNITCKLKKKTNEYGSVTLGGAALSKVDFHTPISVEVTDAPNAMDLTEKGDVDWVHPVGSNDTTDRKNIAEPVIQIKNRYEASDTTTLTDCPAYYSWTDGTPAQTASSNTKGAVFNYKPGDSSSVKVDIQDEAGYEIAIPAADYTRQLTFVSGVYRADAEVSVYLNGSETPIYKNDGFKSESGSAIVKMFAVRADPRESVKVVCQINKKIKKGGNVSLSAVTLGKMTGEEYDYQARTEALLQDAESLDTAGCSESLQKQLKNEIVSSKKVLNTSGSSLDDYYVAYFFLKQAYDLAYAACMDGCGQYMYQSDPKLVSSFGWEGDINAPIAYLDGSYKLRSYDNAIVTFGVTDIPGKVKWYNSEGYLPCFISEYSKKDMDYKVENFSDLVEVDGNKFEVAYSRMTVTNNSAVTKYLPVVSNQLTPLNDAAKTATKIEAGKTVVREYAIPADRFGESYEWPSAEKLAGLGGFDNHYEHMKKYWNDRLEPLAVIKDLPDQRLINAYKAGFIYTMIIRDDVKKTDGSVVKELHVGENGYDKMFDHDTIGIVSTLLTIGDYTNAKEYLTSLPAQLQYDDAKWKYSWPYALYLRKTGNIDFIHERFDVIKTNTHKIETDRVDDGKGIMKTTNAIDSNGYWTIDNWSALMGLTTYRYICGQLGETAEAQWAQAEYDDLYQAVTKQLQETMTKYNLDYIPISMVEPNETGPRSDPRDANWASMFLFGRWGWDGHLFGAEQSGIMLDKIDDTYTHSFERRAAITDNPYNFGGYPHGYFSSAYNAGYGSTALRGENYRDAGIKGYQFMLDESMSGPFGWWEGVGYPSDSSPWDIDHASEGGGSCQHMWGQSTATKVLFDSLIAEKSDDTVIIGRGIPVEWLANGKKVEISNYPIKNNNRIGYKMTTTGTTITVEFAGDVSKVPFSIELMGLKNNIQSANGLSFSQEKGTVAVPVGTQKVTIVMKQVCTDETVSSFEELDSSVATQSVANGTPHSSLNLPSSLNATINEGAQTISGITWSSNPIYVSTAAGTYTFTAKLPSGYVLAKEIDAPAITVVVAEKAGDNSHHNSNTTSSESSKSNEMSSSTMTITTNEKGSAVATVTTKPDAVPVVTGNRSAISVTVPTDVISVITSATKEKPAEVKIAAPAEEILKELNNSAVQAVDLNIKVPSAVANNANANAQVTINVDPSILQAAKNAQKDITLAVTNADTGKEVYSWTFSGTNLKNSIASVVNVNLAMKVSPVKSDAAATAVVVNNTADKKAAGVVLKFENSGLLPSAAKVKVYVGNQEGCTPNSKVFLYYLNTATKLLEQMPQCEYTVDANGYVTITISHCSDYVLLPKAATNPYPVKSDTSFPTGIKTGKSYTFAMTVNGNATPSFAVGNSKAFTSTVKRMGNKYYFTVKAVGTPGTMTAVYSTLSGQKPVVMSYISIVK